MGNRNRLFPLSVAIVLALAACGGGGGGAGPALSGSVSGQVRQNGVGATGVTLRLAGPATGVTTTDSLGNYLFESLPDGSYTVTPEVAPQQVAPSARTLAVAGTPVLAADFDFVTWQVSGSVVQAGHGYPGATVTLRQAGAPDRTATTGWGGDYAFSGLLNGTYTVEAAAAGQSFTPRFPGSVTVTNESVAGCDFLLDTWSVTGAVEWSRSAWTGGGTAILTGEVTLVTELDGAGAFAFHGLPNGTYSVRAYLPNQLAAPSSLSAVVGGADLPLSPFALVTHSLSGRVTSRGSGQEGVGIALGGTVSDSAVSGPDGAFSFAGLPNGTYTLAPGGAGMTFLPASRAGLVVFGGDSPGHDFAQAFLPEVATLGVLAVDTAGGTLAGSVNPNGFGATAWFEYGSDPDPAGWTTTTPASVGSGTLSVPCSLPLSGLPSGETVFYRAAASNANGTTRGAIECFAPDPDTFTFIEVNSLADPHPAPPGKMTIRRALSLLDPGGTVTFHPVLDGGTIPLRQVGDAHSVLMGEVYGPTGFSGYFDRDYGASALYSGRPVAIDASALPNGITLAWAGSGGSRARVLAVYGNLTMDNVTISGGFSSSVPIPNGPSGPQNWTLARGGGLAVWGYANLNRCTVSGNRLLGNPGGGRDLGTYGGGIYANGLDLTDCIIAGNIAQGAGAGGGGIYSVGGADGGAGGGGNPATLTRCAISGNRATAQHTYGGGIFSLGGGPDCSADLTLVNCTVAGNLAEDNPAFPQAGEWYTRGGGIYMGGGNALNLISCTISGNAVSGYAATFRGKPNLGGGGVGATIGNAHVVETMDVAHSVIVGNTLNGAPNDLFTGSLIEFYSGGYNRIGRIDFSQIHVPEPAWYLVRKHYPKQGDADGVAPGDALSLAQAHRHPSVLSAGADAEQGAVLWVPPGEASLGTVPPGGYSVPEVSGNYWSYADSPDTFLNSVLEKLRTDYSAQVGSDFWLSCPDMGGTAFSVEGYTWMNLPTNQPWVAFWRNLDIQLAGRMGQVGLGDDFWWSFSQSHGAVYPGMSFYQDTYSPYYYFSPVVREAQDQLGNLRPPGANSAVGAVESAVPSGFWSRW